MPLNETPMKIFCVRHCWRLRLPHVWFSVLSRLGILSLDWNFWPFLEDFLEIFVQVWKCAKWIISVYFSDKKMPFGSVFSTYHGVPILGCATTDSTIFLCKIGKFSTVAVRVELPRKKQGRCRMRAAGVISLRSCVAEKSVVLRKLVGLGNGQSEEEMRGKKRGK